MVVGKVVVKVMGTVGPVLGQVGKVVGNVTGK